MESVRKVQSEVNVRGEKLLPGRRLATAQPRYKKVHSLIFYLVKCAFFPQGFFIIFSSIFDELLMDLLKIAG